MTERELLVLAYHIARQVGTSDIDAALDVVPKIKLKEVKERRQVCQYIITRVLGAVKSAKRKNKNRITVSISFEPEIADPKPEFEILDGFNETERHVALGLIAGETLSDISKKLNMSVGTVRTVKQQIREKL